MAVRWINVILGTSIPAVVDFTSSIAELCALEPSVLIATFCADSSIEIKRVIANK